MAVLRAHGRRVDAVAAAAAVGDLEDVGIGGDLEQERSLSQAV